MSGAAALDEVACPRNEVDFLDLCGVTTAPYIAILPPRPSPCRCDGQLVITRLKGYANTTKACEGNATTTACTARRCRS